MTGITKDELMQMAREAGIEFKPMRIDGIEYKYRAVHFNDSIGGDEAGCIELLLNTILERAAVECEEKAKSLWATAEMMENELMEKVGDGARECCESIRALKINTGD